MFHQVIMIYKIACVAITSLFIGACLLCWTIYPKGIATLTTIFYSLGYIFLVYEGAKVLYAFAEAQIDTLEDNDKNKDRSFFGFGKAYSAVSSDAQGGAASSSAVALATEVSCMLTYLLT